MHLYPWQVVRDPGKALKKLTPIEHLMTGGAAGANRAGRMAKGQGFPGGLIGRAMASFFEGHCCIRHLDIGRA